MSKFVLDLRECPAPSCVKCPNRDVRKDDKETGFCERFVSARDGLPVRCVGDWAREKIYYLTQYFGIFAQGMKNKFSALRYVEICSGPGRCCTRDGKEIDGTPLTIVNHQHFANIAEAVFFDFQQDVVDVLNKRFEIDGKSSVAKAYFGDYNNPETITSHLRSFQGGSLTLCLIDPTDCSVPFSTIKKVFNVAGGKCDFIISYFDKSDFNRNSAQVAIDKNSPLRDKYEKFVGSEGFFDRDDVQLAAKTNNRELLRKLFTEAYVNNLRQIGLGESDQVRIGKLYQLIFASSHQRGLDFWKKCSHYEPHGQTTFDF